MNESIRFYVLRNGTIFARVASYRGAFDIARLHQKTELAGHSEAHYTIIKGCEQSVAYTA